MKRNRFDPLPVGTEFVESLEDVPEDEHDWNDDADDTEREQNEAPALLRRLLRRG